MSRSRKISLWAFAVILAVLVFFWISRLHHRQPPRPDSAKQTTQELSQRHQSKQDSERVSPISQQASSESGMHRFGTEGESSASQSSGKTEEAFVKAHIPTPGNKTSAEGASTNHDRTNHGRINSGRTENSGIPASSTQELPPPPPLPAVSQSASDQKRKELFALKKSVDHIVTETEPFKVDGKEWTIDEIKRHLGLKSDQPIPFSEDLNSKALNSKTKARESRNASAPMVRKPIVRSADDAFYGVRLVRPGENIWNIHYHILREYFARRHIIIPAGADEPRADGVSSGLGRLLKFLETIVSVYDFKTNKLVTDLNLIHPDSVIVFFKISEVFAALDELKSGDFRELRYVSQSVVLEGAHPKDLLNRETFESEAGPKR